MRNGRSKVIDRNVRFLGVFGKNETNTYVFVHIFQTAEDITKLRSYATFRIE